MAFLEKRMDKESMQINRMYMNVLVVKCLTTLGMATIAVCLPTVKPAQARVTLWSVTEKIEVLCPLLVTKFS